MDRYSKKVIASRQANWNKRSLLGAYRNIQRTVNELHEQQKLADGYDATLHAAIIKLLEANNHLAKVLNEWSNVHAAIMNILETADE